MGARALNSNRIAGWLLAISLVLPSLVGWLPMPLRVQAAVAATAQTAQDATQRLLADLMVLCTPYGLRLAGPDQTPAEPAGKPIHESCVLCGLAAGASLGVLQQVDLLIQPGQGQVATAAAAHTPAPGQAFDPKPPSRGPPY
ncbi:MAG: hypothetical protein AB7R90_05860 [Reyranellaceae bacterium]